jgi:hypothetical protein
VNSGAITLRKVTVVDTGTTSLGIDEIGGSTPVTMDAVNVIARGTGTDVSSHATGTKLTFSNSNYSTVASSGGSSNTPPGTNGNQTAAPAFANPGIGNFHELAGSPTIDAGAAAADIGAFDLDNAPRVQAPVSAARASRPSAPTRSNHRFPRRRAAPSRSAG